MVQGSSDLIESCHVTAPSTSYLPPAFAHYVLSRNLLVLIFFHFPRRRRCRLAVRPPTRLAAESGDPV